MPAAYLQFLRYCLNDSLPLPDSAKGINWKDLMVWAEQQAIVGICFSGIEKLNGIEIKVPSPLLLEWIGYANRIEQQNRLLNKKCVEVVKEYREAGNDCIVLKGQGNAILYDGRCKREEGRCMALLRQPGDIDIWVYSKDDGRSKREEVVELVRRKHPEAEVRYYHIEYMDGGVPVEAHFMPGIMNNPVYNGRLQRWYKGHAEITENAELPDGVGRIPVPTKEFNIVFQLAHMMHHFFDEGIGLRQMIDYYYLLKSNKDSIDKGSLRSKSKENLLENNSGHADCNATLCTFEVREMAEIADTLKYLNLYNFAGAVMYIMKEVLGLEEKYLIVPVDERRGKTLLREILKGGNFGQSDVRWKKAEGRWHTGKKYFLKIARNMQFVREYPAEALCEPVFRTWHFFWRLRNR